MTDFVIFVRHFFSILMMVRHVLIALLVLIAMGAGLISIAEGMNYWEALYLTLITGLTVGYGDVAPTTVLGRIVSVLVALIGLVFFGLVVAVANQQSSRPWRSNALNRRAIIADPPDGIVRVNWLEAPGEDSAQHWSHRKTLFTQ